MSWLSIKLAICVCFFFMINAKNVRIMSSCLSMRLDDSSLPFLFEMNLSHTEEGSFSSVFHVLRLVFFSAKINWSICWHLGSRLKFNYNFTDNCYRGLSYYCTSIRRQSDYTNSQSFIHWNERREINKLT